MACAPARPTTMFPSLASWRLVSGLGRAGKAHARVLSAAAAAERSQAAAAAAGGSAAATAGSAAAAAAAAGTAAVPAQPAAIRQQQQQQQQRVSLVAASPAATQLLAHFFACELRPGDVYLLYGSVGAGKSYFSRAFIRAAADDEEVPVPSPTFLLQNMYTEHQGPPIHHFDLYRLTQRHDFARLDLPASFAQAVCLVEWAERLGLGGSSSGSRGGSSGESQSGGSSSSGGGSSSGGADGAASSSSALLPAEHLDVHISIVDASEQARLQQALAQQLEAAAAAAGSEEGWGEEQGGSDDDGGDARWRRIALSPSGARWQPRLQLLRQYLQAEGAQLGCFLLEEGQGGMEAARAAGAAH